MKRNLSALLIAVLLLSLSACSFQKKSTAQESTSAPAVVEVTTPAPTPIVTAAPVIVEEPAAPAEFISVKASDLYSGYGYAKKEVTETAVYDCKSENSTDGLWKVYILDEEFTEAERYIPSAYRAALTADGSVEACKGQWIYVYCNANEWTGETAPEGAAFTVAVNPDKTASGVQTSYMTSSSTPATTPASATSAVSGGAAPQASASSEGVTITITKNPTEETIKAGTVTQFIAHADGAVSVLWYAIDPDGVYHTLEETHDMFPRMIMQYQNGGDVLCVKWPPVEFSGWRFVARYQNGSVFKETSPVYLWVIE